MNKERTAIIRTHCKDCVFKIGDSEHQDGCKLDRLSGYIEQGVKMELVDGSYVLEKLCIACRDSDWAKDKDNPMQSIKEELEPGIDYIILCDDQEPNLNEIKKTINSIERQYIKAHSVLVSVRKNAAAIYDQLTGEGFKVKVTLSFLADYRDKCIDGCIRQCDGHFYTIIESGKEINGNYSYIVNHLLNDRLMTFVLIEEEPKWEDFPSLILTKMHTMLIGNKNGLLVEKIKIIAEDQKSDMVKKWNDVIKTKS